MSKDQLFGILILLGAIAVLGVYGYMVFFGGSYWRLIALLIVATVAVVGVMGIIAWIGWTMATTPVPEPIESLEEKSSSESVAPEEKKK